MNANIDLEKTKINGFVEFDKFSYKGENLRCAVFTPHPQEIAEADISLLYILPNQKVFVVSHSNSLDGGTFYPLKEMKAYLVAQGVDVDEVLQEIQK